MYGQILQAVKTLAVSYATPYTAIDHGAMPEKNGLAIYPGPGYETERYFDRGGLYEMSIVLNGKHSNLQTLLTALSNIHQKLTLKTEYPESADWQILDIRTSSSPNYLDREQSDTRQWLYGSILAVKFYVKGV